MASSPLPRVSIRTQGGQTGVFARVPFRTGEVVLPVVGEVQSHPTQYSLQVAVDAHLAPRREDLEGPPEEHAAWRFLNHGCRPNARFDVETSAVVAVEPVEPGEEVTLDYNTTEWDVEVAFACRCGIGDCYGIVRGFRHLPMVEQRALLPHVALHIRRLFEQRLEGDRGEPRDAVR